jgi:hypothetical protein
MTDTDSDAGFGERIAAVLDEQGLEELTPDYRDEHREVEQRLETAFDPLPEALAEAPEVAESNKANTHDDGGDVTVDAETRAAD